MNGGDDFDERIRRLDADGRRALLDDLESIRAALGESGATPRPREGAPPDDIPVLDEVVRPAASAAAPTGALPLAPTAHATQTFAQGGADSPNTDAPPRPAEEQGDLFDPRAFADRLLDEAWTEERERILDEARRGADAFRVDLDAEERQRREQAFRTAALERLGPRMELLVGEALDELQDRVLRVLRRELEQLIDETLAPGEGATNDSHEPRERDD